MFTGILFCQGESDTALVRNQELEATYAEALDFLFTGVTEIIGVTPIYIQDLGDRSFYSEELHSGTDNIRGVQRKYALEHENVKVLTTTIDLGLRDTVHLTDDGYFKGAARLADALSGNVAPEATNAVMVNDQTIYVNFDLGTNQLRVSDGVARGIEAIRADGSVIEIADIRRVDRETLAIEFEEQDAAEAVLVRYAHQSVSFEQEGFLSTYGNIEQAVLPFALNLSGAVVLSAAGQNGKDYILGTTGDDILIGDRGANRFITNGGHDTLTGGGGTDEFVFKANNGSHNVTDFESRDHLILRDGLDRDDLTVVQVEENTEIRLADGSSYTLENTNADDLTFRNFWTEGTDQDNAILGSAQDDFIFGGDGDDVIYAGSGLDREYGGAGKDTYIINSQSRLNIVYDFDPENDRIIFEGFDAGDLTFREYKDRDADIYVTTDGNCRIVLRNTDVFAIQESNLFFRDALPDAEVVYGTSGRDELVGTDKAEIFTSHGDIDGFTGGGGADVFTLAAGDRLNIVRDFTIREDKLALVTERNSTVDITAYGDDTQIQIGGSSDRLVIRNIDPEYFGGEGVGLASENVSNILFTGDPEQFLRHPSEEMPTYFADDFSM